MEVLNGQRVVMICGPDRTGKSNIVHELTRRTGIPSFKASSEHSTYLSSKTTQQELFLYQLRYADPRVFDLLKQTRYSVVFDRAYPCEYSYACVMNRPTDHDMLQHIDDMWASIDARIVLCYRTDYTGIVDDLDPNIESHVLNELHDAYWEFARWTKCKVLKLNVDDEDLDREVDEIMEFIR